MQTHFYLMKPIRLGVVATGLAYLGWKTYMVATNFLNSGVFYPPFVVTHGK